jgi:GT2 family glycosyltransferase
MPGTAIVVVSYRTGDTLARCLEDAHRDAAEAVVYLVDHEARTSQHDALCGLRPWIVSLATPENPGFGAGANRGIDRAFADGAERVLLLNDDVYLRPGCAARLAEAVGADGAASPWVVGEGEHAYRGGAIDWQRGYAGHRDGAEDYLLGGCLMISRGAWQATGPFDEAFFLYCEDVDWSLRARQAGVPLVVVPKELAEHVGGASTGAGRSPTWAYWWTRSRILLLRKHGRGSPAATVLRQVGGAGRDALASPRLAAARLKGAVSGLRG